MEQSKPTHTPGPWVAKVRSDFGGTGSAHWTVENPTYEAPCVCGAKHPLGQLIAWMAGGLGDADIVARQPERARHDPNAEANARLIAGAWLLPELVEALRAILAECDQRPKDDDFAYDLARLAAAALERAAPYLEGK